MPLISVIVPVYNVEKYLQRCVDSILSQTFTDFELILVNDGSSDRCPAICDEYAEKDSRVVVIHQKNGGVSAARNAGLDWVFANNQSSWLAFIDSDDWVCSSYLQQLIDSAVHYDVDISCCHYVKMEVDAICPHQSVCSNPMTAAAYWKNYPSHSVVPWGKIYRKSLLENIRYPLGKICDDTFTSHKILFQTERVVWVPEQLYYYFINPNGISQKRSAKLLEQWSEAYEEQAVFFHAKNFYDLRNIALRRMLVHKVEAIKSAKKSREKQTVKKLTEDLGRQINWSAHVLELPLYGHEDIYESAMPVRAALSRKWRHFKRDVRKIIIR